MNKEFINALEEIEKEKGIAKSTILEAIEKALLKSYEKNFDEDSNVEIKIDHEKGDVSVYALKEVVEEVENPNTQVSLEEARAKRKTISYGDILKVKVVPKNFGRVAAQTARNIVIQQIRDAERQAIYEDFIDRERELITGDVQRIDFNNIYINLGKTEGFIPPSEQVPNEVIEPGDRVKLFVSEVKATPKGPQIILSRSSSNLIKRLFEVEVPEIHEGVVEIISIAREAGFRTKMAVYANDDTVDPVGACVGFKGARVNAIVDEINGEKIDIIVWSPDIKTFISNSLSPSDVVDVIVNEDEKSAIAIVPDDQLSLAIGKEGQNVRLAAKLTNWKIDIKGDSQHEEVLEMEAQRKLKIEEEALQLAKESLEREEAIEEEEIVLEEPVEEVDFEDEVEIEPEDSLLEEDHE